MTKEQAENQATEFERLLRVAMQHTPPRDWDALASARGADADALAQLTASAAVTLSRMSEYFSRRNGDGCGDQGHTRANKGQQAVSTKVRRALGYAYPVDQYDIPTKEQRAEWIAQDVAAGYITPEEAAAHG